MLFMKTFYGRELHYFIGIYNFVLNDY